MAYTLILTSCIKVDNPDFVKRNQTAVRLRDYERALTWWLRRQNVIKRIIFCDNSGYPLDSLAALAKKYKGDKEIEFLSYRFTNYQTRGYGWGEIDIYRHVVVHARLLADSDYLVFCAGRKYVKNIERLCRQLPADFDIAHNWLHNLSWAEADLFFIKKDIFVEEFLPLVEGYHNERDGYYIQERAVSYASHTLINQDYTWYPLPMYPAYRGVMGRKDISLWWRLDHYPVYNQYISLIGRLHWRRNRTVFDCHQQHLLDRLKIRRRQPTLKRTT